MSKHTEYVIYPSMKKKLETMGKQIKLARLRRNLTVELVAERANVSKTTVWAVEKGSPTVAMGIYACVLAAIGLGDDILLLAKDDEVGRAMQDLNLRVRARASSKKRGDESTV
ncbi:MAG: helix-turn-helix transcriptional regulator [Oribacterium sp.]|jgi:transcriptional regulator with XRE-family HTH domain|nr:helix-turn-helix transcriptional regulator [Oribacterium sp.]MDY6307033.1 helix-turn-helix transcriptional regulator [Oribacterium sp.]MDY6317301.1 helix-turn-helix transcriptional regulator [Oribacterium sp.]